MPGRLARKRAASDDLEDEQAQADVELDDTAESPVLLDDLTKKLVRLALAHESQRRPLRRQDISDKVLGPHKQFKKVFGQAQHELQTIFGMKLVELPAREKLTVAQRRAAQKKTAPHQTTTAWILTSIIPKPDMPPSSNNEAAYTGLYTIIIALVSLSGGMLTEARLDRFLSRLQLEENTPLKGYEKKEILLKRMERDGYLVKIRENIGISGEEEISWALGSRAKVEVGLTGVKGLVETVYGPMDVDAQDALTKKLERSLGMASRSSEEHITPSTQQERQ